MGCPKPINTIVFHDLQYTYGYYYIYATVMVSHLAFLLLHAHCHGFFYRILLAPGFSPNDISFIYTFHMYFFLYCSLYICCPYVSTFMPSFVMSTFMVACAPMYWNMLRHRARLVLFGYYFLFFFFSLWSKLTDLF